MSRTRRRNWLAHSPHWPDEPAIVRDGKTCPRGFVNYNRDGRRGYEVLGCDVVRLHDDCQDLGLTAGSAMRLARRRLIQRDWDLYLSGEFDDGCLRLAVASATPHKSAQEPCSDRRQSLRINGLREALGGRQVLDVMASPEWSLDADLAAGRFKTAARKILLRSASLAPGSPAATLDGAPARARDPYWENEGAKMAHGEGTDTGTGFKPKRATTHVRVGRRRRTQGMD